VPATVIDGWIGSGYGLASPAGEAAIDLVARTEGVFLDPVFGAKAMAALIDGCLSGAVTGPVVFVVTGGGPTLFAAPSAPDAVEVPVAQAGAEPG
jgi:D-cysteine desulfhydrase